VPSSESRERPNAERDSESYSRRTSETRADTHQTVKDSRKEVVVLCESRTGGRRESGISRTANFSLSENCCILRAAL